MSGARSESVGSSVANMPLKSAMSGFDLGDFDQELDFQSKLLKGTFTFTEFAENLRKLKKLGSMKDLMRMVPGLDGHLDELGIEEDDLVKVEAIINSMTHRERSRPEILKASRRDRIARGSGTSRLDVDDLIKQFCTMKKMMRRTDRLK